MSASDHYRTLGLDRTADTAAIKAAFRRLAKLYHPDRNPRDPGAPVRFREIVEAYEELADDVRRAAYDLTLRRSTTSSNASPRASTHYEARHLGSRIDKAIETFDRLTQIGWRDHWRRHLHARIFLQALDEVCEFELRLTRRSGSTVSPGAQDGRMQSSLQRLQAALLRWKARELFVHADKLFDAADIAGQSPIMFMTNPDVAAVESRLSARHTAYANMPEPEGYVSPDCSSRGIFSLGPGTLGVLTPGLIRLKGVQDELDVALMCAAFAKKHWLGRWVLNSSDNPEHLFRLAVAAEVIGVDTIGYEIPVTRRREADWVKRQVGKRNRIHWLSAAGLAEKRCARIMRSLHYTLDRPSFDNFAQRVSVLYSQDLAGRMAGLQRMFFERPKGYRRVHFGMDFES